MKAAALISLLVEGAPVDTLDWDILEWISMGKHVPMDISDTVYQRLSKLLSRGYLLKMREQEYQLTSKGKEALRENVTA